MGIGVLVNINQSLRSKAQERALLHGAQWLGWADMVEGERDGGVPIEVFHQAVQSGIKAGLSGDAGVHGLAKVAHLWT